MIPLVMKLNFHVILTLLVTPALLGTLGAGSVHAQSKDTTKAAVDGARKAAKDAGVDLPEVKQEDLDKLMRKVSDEVAKSREKKETEGKAGGPDAEKPAKPGADPEAPSIRIEKLPDWIPAIAGFKAQGTGRQWDGAVVTGKLKGTSTATPATLAQTWVALDGKGFAAEHTTRKAAGITRETVRLIKAGDTTTWVELQAEPGADGAATAVRVTYSQPGK